MNPLGIYIFNHIGMLNMWRKEIESWSDEDIVKSRIFMGARSDNSITDFAALKEKGMIFEEGQEIDDDLIGRTEPHLGLHWSLQFGDPTEAAMAVNSIMSICFIRLIMPRDGYDIRDMAKYSTVIFAKAQKGKTLYDDETGSSGVILKCYSEPIVPIDDTSLMQMRIMINWQSKVASKIRS